MKNRILLLLKGVAMGAADVVPGVSGGTIAFITGIYEELLSSIKSVNLTAIKLLFTFKLRAFWTHINGTFLLFLLLGIALAVVTTSRLMVFLLDTYPILVWSFFFGLIIASSVMVARQIKRWNISTILSLLIGVATAFYITVATPSTTPNDWWFIILSGSIAICAMILPGISGSFILLLLGKYSFIMTALSTFDMPIIALFGVGAIIGITAFSHVLSWLLKKFHTVTIALLTGFMIGSLNKVWPWKDSHGEVNPMVESNVLPSSFQGDAQLLEAILMCLFGFVLIMGIEQIAKRIKRN